jgi:hypothetical protein
MTERYKNITHLSEITGLDRTTIRKRLDGIEPNHVKGRSPFFDCQHVLPILYQLGEKMSIKQQLEEEQLRHERVKADKVTIDVERMRGEVVPIEDVCKAVSKEYSYVRAAILTLPSKIAKPISLEEDPAKCQMILKREVDEILAHLQVDTSQDFSSENEEVVEEEKYFDSEEKKE